MKKINDYMGITLIALIITIIVLLILAGVTIVTLTGDNGLLSKTAVAKEENIKGEEKEKIALGFNEYRIKKYTETKPELTVEGASSVTGDETNGWTIGFDSGRVYELKTDGTIEEINKQTEISTTEDSITVKLKSSEYKYNQFSLDGINWSNKQSENVYTFNNLEKTVVNKSNYNTVTGKEYTVYCKSENDNGDITTHAPTKVKLPVELQADEYDQEFAYTEENGEICITGFNINASKMSSRGVNSYLNEDTIVVPSYIDGKPVTKIDARVLKAPNSYEGIKSFQIIPNTNNSVPTNLNTLIASNQKFSDVNYVSERNIAVQPATSLLGFIGKPIDEGNNSRYLYLGASKLIVSSTNNWQEGTEGSISSATRTAFASISIMPNIILPPTVKEVISHNISSTTDSKNTKKLTKIGAVTSKFRIIKGKIDDDGDIRYDDVKIVFGFRGAKLIGDDYYFPIHVKILGKSNKEEIRNIGEVVSINGENASEKIDFEVIN